MPFSLVLQHQAQSGLNAAVGRGHNKQRRRLVKICRVDRHGERGARAYNGGLEAEPKGINPPLPFPPVKTRRICINFRSDL